MRVIRAATQGKELQRTANLGITKGGRFGIGKGAQFAGAGFDDAAWEMIREGRGFGAGAL